jgi:hypothetical protein
LQQHNSVVETVSMPNPESQPVTSTLNHKAKSDNEKYEIHIQILGRIVIFLFAAKGTRNFSRSQEHPTK